MNQFTSAFDAEENQTDDVNVNFDTDAIFGDAIPFRSNNLSVSRQGKAVDIGGLQVSSTGMVINGDLHEEQWYALLDGIQKIKSAYQWILGDWLNYGVTRKYGETSQQVTRIASATGYSEQYLSDLTWVCGAIEISCRKENLSYKHHWVVVRATDDEQKREEYLQAAIRHDLSASALKAHIEGHNVVNPTTIDIFRRRFGSFEKQQLKAAKKATPAERQTMADELRVLAEKIEKTKSE
ncbi:MAG: hypothetical protein ACPG7F_00120 [Aggregatilineales bacterium]